MLWWLVAVVCSPVSAAELRGNVDLLGQVREGDHSRETEAPLDFYGDAGISGLSYRSSFDTFFRLNRDFGREDGASDFYAGYLRTPGLIPGVELTAGRQFLSEGPGGVFVADGGKIRIDRGWPVSVTLFGGVPRYFEPTFSSEILSQDELVWGGTVQSRRWNGGQLGLGYLHLERDEKVLRQLVTGTATQAFTQLPGLPSVYGSFAYDADRQNLDLATGGANLVFSRARLLLNFEGSYYKPHDRESGDITTDLNRREDPIFELFSVGRLLQYRGGLRHPLTRTLSIYGDYSYQRYQRQLGDNENGHVGSAGLLWLPGGDGLETVRLEYYVIDSGGGNVNGASSSYESRVYEGIVFRAKLDVTYYEKVNNQDDVPLSGFVGVSYVLKPGLTGELSFEANRNDRFDEDFRFGFRIAYRFRHSTTRPRPVRRDS